MEADTPSARDQAIDMHTLAAIYDQYYPLIYRYVRYRLDSVPLVEDITSEVFIRLLEVLQKQRLITNLRGWLFGAASNIIHTHLRAKYRHPEVSLSDQERLSSHDSTEEEIDKITSMDQTRLAFQALTEEQQHVLALRFSQQFSIDETAQTMNKSVNAIKVLQFRALAALRRGMEKRQAA